MEAEKLKKQENLEKFGYTIAPQKVKDIRQVAEDLKEEFNNIQPLCVHIPIKPTQFLPNQNRSFRSI